jgi:tmRNA-binding protein
MSIIPLILYFNNKGLVKITIGLGKGKKKYDKRATTKEREWRLKKDRILKKK